MSRRRKAREAALQLLYQAEHSQEPLEQVLASFWQGMKADAPTREFAEQLFRGALAQKEEIDTLIKEASEHWRLQRMAAVDRNILRLGVYELMARPDTPAAVVIDEAIEIARRFSAADSAEFVNGILDAVHKKLAARSGVESG